MAQHLTETRASTRENSLISLGKRVHRPRLSPNIDASPFTFFFATLFYLSCRSLTCISEILHRDRYRWPAWLSLDNESQSMTTSLQVSSEQLVVWVFGFSFFEVIGLRTHVVRENWDGRCERENIFRILLENLAEWRISLLSSLFRDLRNLIGTMVINSLNNLEFTSKVQHRTKNILAILRMDSLKNMYFSTYWFNIL